MAHFTIFTQYFVNLPIHFKKLLRIKKMIPQSTVYIIFLIYNSTKNRLVDKVYNPSVFRKKKLI